MKFAKLLQKDSTIFAFGALIATALIIAVILALIFLIRQTSISFSPPASERQVETFNLEGAEQLNL